MRDHLGNTRVTFTDANNDGVVSASDIKQINHYYPFGLNMEGNWQGGSWGQNKYQYNGKELNQDFGLDWNDYGARFYDPALARWTAVDPLAEKYMRWSPYNYCKNNPINLIDPDGMGVDDPPLKGGSQTVTGGIIENEKSSFTVLNETTTSVSTENILDADKNIIGQRSTTTSATATDLIDKNGEITLVQKVDVTTTVKEIFSSGKVNQTSSSAEISRSDYNKTVNSSLGDLSGKLSAYAQENKSHFLSQHTSMVSGFKDMSKYNFAAQGTAAGFIGSKQLAALTSNWSTNMKLGAAATAYIMDKVFDNPLNTDGLNKALESISSSSSIIVKVKAWGADSKVHYDRVGVNIPVKKK